LKDEMARVTWAELPNDTALYVKYVEELAEVFHERFRFARALRKVANGLRTVNARNMPWA
jgi:hypothetical protein